MLNGIKNAQSASKETVSFTFSNFKYEVARVLEESGLIEKIEKKGRGVKKTLEIQLKYEDKLPVISGFKKISKPSQRIYSPADKIKSTKRGQGIIVISTPQGLMTDRQAKEKKQGGEIICEVW